jgi:hypothetical protein
MSIRLPSHEESEMRCHDPSSGALRPDELRMPVQAATLPEGEGRHASTGRGYFL